MCFGKFGPVSEKLKDITSIENFNLQIKFPDWTHTGILNETGTNIHFEHGSKKKIIDELIWYPNAKSVPDTREHISNRSHFYNIQPENQGKLIFLSGPPGSGKSTTAMKLAKKYDFVFYEGDGYMFRRNPYVPLNSGKI